MQFQPKNYQEADVLAAEVAKLIRAGGLVFLQGALGSGKTTFAKNLAHHLGIAREKVQSPTYAYIRQYSLSENQNLYHIDLYRLENPDHELEMEITEILTNPTNIVLVEWPERLGSTLSPQITVQFKMDNER